MSGAGLGFDKMSKKKLTNIITKKYNEYILL